MQRRKLICAIAGLGATLTLGLASAFAEEVYPRRPVKILIPFPPPGSTDVFTRKFALRLGAVLGQPVVAENRTGAGGSIASAEVARSTPDGYTLMMATSSTHTIIPTTMVRPTYDPVADFAPISVLGTQPLAIVVHPAVPARTLQELIALIRANPGKYAYASSGTGGIAHLAGEMFAEDAGKLQMQHIPYKGGAPALQDVMAGHVPILFDTFSPSLPHHRSGKLRVLAVLGETRSPAAPDIPTASESLPGYLAFSGNIFLAPARTPRPVLDILFRATSKVMADKAFLKELNEMSIEPVIGSDPAKAAQFIRVETARWAPIIKATGIKME